MNRLFSRLFLLIMVSVTVASVAVYIAVAGLFGDPLEQIARSQATAQIFLLEQYIDKGPAEEWLARLNKARSVSHVGMDVIPLKSLEDALSQEKLARLRRGELVIDIPGKALLRRVDLRGERYVGSDEDVIQIVGLPIDIGFALEMEALRYVVVALCLLVPIAFWSRSHWRGLQELSRAAEDFGAGQLDRTIAVDSKASIYPLARCMHDMAQRIRRLLDDQRALLHSVSHELRTPIARLEFGLELLREDSKGRPVQPRIDAMNADLLELGQLVNELLTLSALEHARSLPGERFAVVELLHECLRATRDLAAGKELASAFSGDLGGIVGDRRLLARAIGNLLSNAIKYSARRILLSARRAEDGALQVSVEDDGPGVPVEARARVFEPFFRLDRSRDRSTGGYGLGLAIAQKAALLHGGRIDLDDSGLGGAMFRLTIPPAGAAA